MGGRIFILNKCKIAVLLLGKPACRNVCYVIIKLSLAAEACYKMSRCWYLEYRKIREEIIILKYIIIAYEM